MSYSKCELDSVVDEAIALMCNHVMAHAKNTDQTLSKWFWREEVHRRAIRAYVQTELAWGNR